VVVKNQETICAGVIAGGALTGVFLKLFDAMSN
jgi:hypothetical protein